MDPHIKNELHKIAPGFPERKRYNVPEGYFESLPQRMIDLWNERHPVSGTKVIRLRKMISVAAMVAGISFAIALFTQPHKAPSMAGQVTPEDAYSYISYHIEEFESLLDVPLPEADYDDFQMITTDDAEEYLLEEFSGSELEQIF